MKFFKYLAIGGIAALLFMFFINWSFDLSQWTIGDRISWSVAVAFFAVMSAIDDHGRD